MTKTERAPSTDERAELKTQGVLARKLPDHHLNCRLVGHHWDRVAADRTPLFGVLVVWECQTCGTKRDDIIDRSRGALLSRSYRYVQGYELPKANGQRGGAGALRVKALRVELLRRASS
jgi:hypothetical protein